MRRRSVAIAFCLFVATAAFGQATHDHATTAPAPARAAAGNHHDMMFADMMVMHHQEGIEMARLAVSKADDADVRAMAQKMIDDQTGEIDQLRALRPAGPQHSMEEMHSMMMPGTSHAEMHAQMEKEKARLGAATGHEFDLAFTEIMAKHHQGAIMMSEHELKQGESAGLKDLARQIAAKQRTERQQLLTMNDRIEETHTSMTSAAESRRRMTKD